MNITKKTKILFFLSFIVVAFAVPVGVSTATEIETEDTTITYDWLYVDINETSLGNLNAYTGGKSLYAVKQLPVENKGDGLFQFAFNVGFGFQTVIYTSEDLYSMFPDIKTDAVERYVWLKYAYFILGFIQSGYPIEYEHTFSTIKFGEMNRANYDVEIPITVGLNPSITFKDFSGERIGGLPIATSNYAYQVKTVQAVGAESREIGQYDDIIQENVPSEEDTYADISVEKLGPRESVKSRAYNLIAEKNLGARITSWTTTTTGYGQPEKKQASLGNYDNRDLGDFTFRQPIELRPRVEVTKGQVELRRVPYLGISDNIFFTLTDLQPVETLRSPGKIPEVYKTAHVYNYAIKLNYKVSVDFICNVQIDNYEEYQGSLNLPLFEQGDWIWDFQKGGTTSMTFVDTGTIFEQALGGLFDWIFTILVAIVVIAIIYAILKSGLIGKIIDKI